MTQNQKQLPEDVYSVFCSNIDTVSVQRIFGNITGASVGGVKRVHMLFQSPGGVVGDGVCLYNFFKSLPIDLILYNVGSVASIATIAYLGAKTRKTTASATFMLHRTHFSPQMAKSKALQAMADAATMEDRRTEGILRASAKLTDEQWKALDLTDLYFDSEQALKAGIATEIGEFAPPPGTTIFNI